MYILRTTNHVGGVSSGNPDGMFVREDGWFTDNKVSAKLFDNPQAAVDHYHNVLAPLWNYQAGGSGAAMPDLFVVEVEVKYVVKKVLKPIVARM